jgi:putative ABC transport system ATP-binding protein
MIRISNLIHFYTSESKIQFPNWEVVQGEECLLIGASGSGKTTLLHILAGLMKPQTGEIIVANQKLTSKTNFDVFRGRNLGLVFQQPHLIQVLNVQDNLFLAQYLTKSPRNSSAVFEALEAVGMKEKAKAKVFQLSQGQQQRVAIARAVLNSPKVILADEPTASLDDENAASVLQILRDQAKKNGATLIIATHDNRLKIEINQYLKL